MSRRLTNDEFVFKSQKIHIDDNHMPKYIYKNTKYLNSKSKVIITCKIHGDFLQIAYDHLSGHGCQKCSGRGKCSHEEFVLRGQKIHQTKEGEPKYDYSEVVYINNKTKVKIKCYKHGIFEQKAESHINQKNGCPKCAGVGIPTTKEFINKCKSIHKDEFGKCRYDYSKTIYNNANSKISVICYKHGEFNQIASYHLRGHGCPLCKSSKGEMKILKFLTYYNIENVRNKRFSDCKNKYSLPFDFYLPTYNLCIEYDGELHYNVSGYRNGVNKLLNIKNNDEIKNKYCKHNNIKIIRIPYWNFNNIDIILSKELNIP